MEASKANIVEAFNQNREDFTGAQRQIGTDHDYIHSGKGFSYSKSATINTGSSLLLMFITGANKYIHLRPTVISSMAGAVTVKVKEGGTYIKPAGTLVSGEKQNMVFADYIHQDIENQNYDGSIITVNSVTGSINGLLTVTTDYTVSLSGGKYGITPVSGGNISTLEEQTFEVDYDYTPVASAETVYNRNRNSAEITTIDGVYVSPTESVAGAVLWNTSVGSGGSPQSRSGGSLTGESDEWVLKPNEEYVIEIANSSGSNSVVNINLFWYEEDEGV